MVDSLDDARTRAYIDGRNAARSGYSKDIPYYDDDLCTINWECRYDDWVSEMFEDTHVSEY